MKRHHIAVIPGDGIGKEVIREGIRVVDAAGSRFGDILSDLGPGVTGTIGQH